MPTRMLTASPLQNVRDAGPAYTDSLIYQPFRQRCALAEMALEGTEMTAGAQRQASSALPPPWPGDRYEVVCQRAAPFAESRDRYHFARYAAESAQALEEAGLATRVVVIRMADETVIYDPMRGVSVPPELW